MTEPLDFAAPDLATRVESLPPGAVDRLPFGAVRLDAAGRVLVYSQAEARLSGYGDRPAVGLDFFAEIAPCMDQPGFRGRLAAGLASGRVQAHFTWIGDFADRERMLEVRLQGIPGGGCWIFLRRED
ncbi:PAS domain-containing protein [Dankookia sp. GCM10030260]|uniref:PAS domain-containing protein n=1 Tax=Dankookia sp. GCM10030260 TaxID=3273390 RepID=UPI0036149CCD